MLDGNEAFKKTLIDEQIEIRQKFQQDDAHTEAYETYRMMKAGNRVKNNIDKSFENEADLIADAKECG